MVVVDGRRSLRRKMANANLDNLLILDEREAVICAAAALNRGLLFLPRQQQQLTMHAGNVLDGANLLPGWSCLSYLSRSILVARTRISNKPDRNTTVYLITSNMILPETSFYILASWRARLVVRHLVPAPRTESGGSQHTTRPRSLLMRSSRSPRDSPRSWHFRHIRHPRQSDFVLGVVRLRGISRPIVPLVVRQFWHSRSTTTTSSTAAQRRRVARCRIDHRGHHHSPHICRRRRPRHRRRHGGGTRMIRRRNDANDDDSPVISNSEQCPGRTRNYECTTVPKTMTTTEGIRY